jgi:hypothetical protein
MEEKGAIHKTLETHIVRQTTWDNLPAAARQLVNNSREVWDDQVVTYSIRLQLRWRSSLVRTIKTDERQYYDLLVKSSRSNLMVMAL